MSDIDFGRVNLNLLPALQALLREGSVGRAARRMGVSQSAMSHSLAKLRDLLDDDLMVAQGRTMSLTPRARQLESVLPEALEQLQRALRGPAAFDPATAPLTIRIATVDYFEITSMAGLLRHLAVHAPHVKLRIVRLGADSVAALQDGRIDLILGGTSLMRGAGVRSTELYRDPFKVIVRPEHPGVGRRLTLSSYTAYPHVVVQFEGAGQAAVDRVLSRQGRRRTVGLQVPHFISAPLAVAASDMISTVASAVAERARELLGLRVLEPPISIAPAPVTMAWPRAHDADPARTWFRELLRSGDTAPPTIRTLIRAARSAET